MNRLGLVFVAPVDPRSLNDIMVLDGDLELVRRALAAVRDRVPTVLSVRPRNHLGGAKVEFAGPIQEAMATFHTIAGAYANLAPTPGT